MRTGKCLLPCLLDVKQATEKADTKTNDRNQDEDQQQRIAGDRGRHSADVANDCRENFRQSRDNLSKGHSNRLIH